MNYNNTKRIKTIEAFKEIDNGKVIESITGYRYKKENGILLTQYHGEFRRCGSISAIELEESWLIIL